ncbi:MAG: cell envelope integrity EipB family protein [Alphaproteobacteria bacterium]|nr:cell envelope integrity EipB family protein [Alphaproteobacteria bacterium]
MSRKIIALVIISCLFAPFSARAEYESIVPSKITVIPHRAIYNMSLASVKNGSNITGVSGKMMFEWSDTCDGWAVQQHLKLRFTYAQGDGSDIGSSIVTWESKDGKMYNFNVRRTTDGKETENYRGKSSLGETGGSGKYAIPKSKEVKFGPNALFPSAHTVLILSKALDGEKFFMRPVFDGSDEDGIADVSAFIGSRLNDISSTEMNPKLRDNALLSQPGWPVRLAFFKLKTETGEPDYEMNLTLLANGVAKFMQIDYGDFSISGVLEEIEKLPAPGC